MMGSLPCLKHDPRWSKRLYWVLNKLHGNLIPKSYQKRASGLLCNCGRTQFPSRNDPFENVSHDELLDSFNYMDNFIQTTLRHQNLDVFKRLMLWLRTDGVIRSGERPPALQSGQCLSAYRLLYILQQCLLQNYTFLDPPPPINRPNQPEIEEKTLTFILEDCPHNLVGSVIGRGGIKLRPLLKQFKCHIKVDKVAIGDDLKVKVVVRKKTQSMETLERVKAEVEKLAKDVVEDEKNHQETKIQQREEYKQDFKQLLKKTEGMSKTASWNDILGAISNDRTYFIISLRYTHEDIKRWFEEIQKEWEEPLGEASGPSISRAFEASGTSIIHQNDLSDEESDETELKGGAATGRTGELSRQPLPSTSRMGGTLGPTPYLNTAQVGPSTSEVAGNISSTSSTPYLNTAQEGRLLGADNRLSVCLVHDRRWVPTYQFTLTRCYTALQLEKKYGRTFSRFVCCCQGPIPGFLQHFRDEADLIAKFNTVKEKIQDWPLETQDIMQPLIKQLEKGMKAETFQSLYRFVFLYMNLVEGKTECLQPSFRLPYSPSTTSDQSIITHPETEELGEIVRSPPSVVTSGQKRKVLVEDRSESCYFHGKKRRATFQCVVNYLHKSANMPQKYGIPFCKSVCCCNEDDSSPSHYSSQHQDKLQEDCKFMKNKLSLWRGESKANIQQYIEIINRFLNGTTPQLERAFEKFVFFFNCAFKREYSKFVKN